MFFITGAVSGEGAVEPFGVVYILLALVAMMLWARTNPATQAFNLWRFFLISTAAVGALVSLDLSWLAYCGVYGGLVTLLTSHTILFLGYRPKYGWLYVVVTYIAMSGSYWLVAWFMQPHIKLIAPAIIVLPGLFFTYTPLGRRWWAVYAEAQRQLYP